MNVSVVVCTYSTNRYRDFCEAVESVLAQTYESVEVVLVIDGNETVHEWTTERFGKQDEVVIHCNEENRGLSYSRTQGVEHASGDIIAFIDDDAIADLEWVEELVRGYEETDAIAVGGRMVPEWVVQKPTFLPKEFYWLIGVNYEERLKDWSEVRNTNGSNMSFRRMVFDELGGFDEQVGMTEDNQIQAEETEFAIRMQQAFGQGMLYNPDAIVAHKVFDYRTDPVWLGKRAFWQGYSKRAIAELESKGVSAEETDFLAHLAVSSVPKYMMDIVRNRSKTSLKRLLALFFFTACVGLGYLYGIARPR